MGYARLVSADHVLIGYGLWFIAKCEVGIGQNFEFPNDDAAIRCRNLVDLI